MTSNEQFDPRPRVKHHRLNILPENPELAATEDKVVGAGRFPSWLHRKLPNGTNLWKTGDLLNKNRLHTVCEEARCPNLLECWSKKTATFLVMGKECTRNCGFCDIDFSKAPKGLEDDEPDRVADSVKQLGLKHVVITMVARDDLEDGGAAHLAKVIETTKIANPDSTIEVLTSDFSGNLAAVDVILAAKPDIFNHNIETVRDLTPRVRHKATYDRSLRVLKHVKEHSSILTKSGIMVGLGETESQVQEALQDLKQAGVSIVTMGQYLQPNPHKLLVKSFVTPEQFKQYEVFGNSIGISNMYCGPFVRSSYNAAEVFNKTQS